ncbi:MAG: DivIVA domain-containing protein [Bacteroidota bacterium]
MQQITPLEIRQKRFEKSFRGYNQEEVDAFLYSLAYAWEQSVAKLSDMTAQLESSNG